MEKGAHWPAPVVSAVAGALKTVLGEDDFEIVPDDHLRALYVCADDWTVNIEWQRDIAWLAIDDEPGDPDDYERARRVIMSEAVEAAWAAADRELSGYLVDAMKRSGDAFSIAFAEAISLVPPED
jgi:hypothetical protein